MHVHVQHGRDPRVNAPHVDAMPLHDSLTVDSHRAMGGGRRDDLGLSALEAGVVGTGMASALAYRPTTTSRQEKALQSS